MKKLILCVLTVLLFGAVLRAESTGEILTFPANPDKGFHWGYALYLPKTMDTTKTLPMLLIMGNTGRYDLSVEETEKNLLERLREQSSESPVADALGVPLVVPMILRTEKLYTHALSRAVLVSQDEKFKRLDLQVLNMLKDAREQLKNRHIKTQKKVLVTGFSAAGVFAWRWTMLHPEYVLATVTGGALYHMLPVEQLNGERLIYPVGVGDLQEITGKKFNKKAWSKIPIFSTNGEMDDNDTFPWEMCFDPKVERPVLASVLPGKDIFERRAQSIQLLNQLAPNVQTHLYPWLGHKPVEQDMIGFLRQHINGGPLQSFTPKDTSGQKPSMVSVEKVMWGDDLSLSEEERSYVSPDRLVLKTNTTTYPWVYKKFGQISILQDEKEVLSVPARGSITLGSYSLITYRLSPEERAVLRNGKDRTFSVRSHHPEFLDIPENLTFTVK